jgi:3-dehydroquinate synthase
VGVGLALDTTYSYLSGLLPKEAWQRVLELLTNLGLALYVPELQDRQAVLQGLEEFRAHLGGRLTVMLLWEIGQGLEANEIEPETVMAAIDLLRRVALETGKQLAVSS